MRDRWYRLFVKEQPPRPPGLTRFDRNVECQEITDLLAKLVIKKEQLKKLADEKGALSAEYEVYIFIKSLVETCAAEIQKFNHSEPEVVLFSEKKAVHALISVLKSASRVTRYDKEMLNRPQQSDSIYVRNHVLLLALLALPLAPLAVGAGVGSAIATASWAVAGNEALKYIKVIDWDTESLKLVSSFADTVDKTEKALSSWLMDCQLNPPARLSPT